MNPYTVDITCVLLLRFSVELWLPMESIDTFRQAYLCWAWHLEAPWRACIMTTAHSECMLGGRKANSILLCPSLVHDLTKSDTFEAI